MTTEELRKFFNDNFNLNQWPTTYEVDHETYANVCQFMFEYKSKTSGMYWDTVENGKEKSTVEVVAIGIGMTNKGILFKGVELILKKQETAG